MSPELKAAAVQSLQAFIGAVGPEAWAKATEDVRELATAATEDAIRMAALALLDAEQAKVEKAVIEGTLANLKVAFGFTVVSMFWKAVKSVLATVAPILLNALVGILA
jgi:hypothetical protein